MKRNILLAASLAGLLCGLTLKWLNPIKESKADTRFTRKIHVPDDVAEEWTAGKEWKRRFSKYLGSMRPTGLQEKRDLCSEADAALRLLEQPVSAASIQEGIVVLNRFGNQQQRVF